jgi:hypothetical protein
LLFLDPEDRVFFWLGRKASISRSVCTSAVELASWIKLTSEATVSSHALMGREKAGGDGAGGGGSVTK